MPSGDDTDDQIVWSLSDSETSSTGSSAPSGDSVASDDFVLLSPSIPASGRTTVLGGSIPRPRTTTMQGSQLHTPVTSSNLTSLEAQMATMSINAQQDKSARKLAKKELKKSKVVDPATLARRKAAKKSRKEKKKAKAAQAAEATATAAYPSPAPSPKKEKIKSPPNSPSKAVVKATGLGSRPIVDDISDRQSVVSEQDSTVSPTLYEEASTFISRFLSNPDAKNDSVCRLTLLQSLIIELGLGSSNLPASLKSAKTFLKSRAFLNIKEYLAVREQGPEAVQKAMYPSRSALIKNIRKPTNRVPLQWVKAHGLQVLLVGWMH
ncbi:hypothetical protein CPB83DRAFT_866938 [Crepidotus variabilis]|uniref:Uncharacterized protein n=1 Tax=Crepidotus variabilis TaxID=179855 RepID=A0A9P6EQD8_9AGAR|nr:hypothetical protein CPB83DRAFT_866938 [Crepidotus variabilis]